MSADSSPQPPARQSEIARAIWLAMVNDEAPDDETLRREGYFDAADAVLAMVGGEQERLREALIAVRSNATVSKSLHGWLLPNDTFEKVRVALEGDDA